MSNNFTRQGENRSDVKKNQDSILDIFSDILQLNGDSLVPKSIGRACLENAKVLNQVDKKFIAVVAGKTLAMIDQVVAFSKPLNILLQILNVFGDHVCVHLFFNFIISISDFIFIVSCFSF